MKNRSNKHLKRICTLSGTQDSQRALEVFLLPYRRFGRDLESIAQNLGVEQIVEQEMPFDGGIFDGQQGLTIKINSRGPSTRRRFTLAHEIGHLLLEPGQNGRRTRKCAPDQDLERACDSIATELLMPASEVREFVSKLYAPSTDNLRRVSREFGVSLQTAARRLHDDLKIWKCPFGLWRWDGGPKELWFTGRRLWATRRPSFAAFELARQSGDAVRTREYYSRDGYTEAVSLEVLQIGRECLLGMIAAGN